MSTKTYHLLGRRLCEQADGCEGDQGHRGQDHGEVEVVDVLDHGGALVRLVAGRLHVNEVQDEPKEAQEQAQDEAPEGTLPTRARSA